MNKLLKDDSMTNYKQVFISYKAEEFDVANWVKSTLEHNGISCWMAPTSIPGGSSYASEIEQAIQNCKVFVLLLSDKSQNSKWVAKELDRALNANKIIMPFVLENCALKDDFNFYLTNVQRYEAYLNKVNAMKTMILDIRKIIGNVQPDFNTPQSPSAHAAAPATAPVAPSAPVTVPVAPSTPAAVQTPVTAPIPSSSKITIAGKQISKKLLFGVAAAVILLVILIVSFAGGSDSGNSGQNDTPGIAQTSDKYVEENQNVTLSDDLADTTFILDGVTYQLPCRYTTFINNGWTISTKGINGETKIAGNSKEYVTISKNGTSVTIYPYNLSGNAKPISDCYVGEITCEAYNEADFSIAKGITPKSSAEEITAAFGSAHTQNKYSDYQTLEYVVSDNCSTKFYVYANEEDRKYSSITIKNFVYHETDATETITDIPEYLSSYKAPTSLGNQHNSGIIMIEDDLYCLPAPVSVFLDNGWEITQQSASIVAGDTDSIRIEKDGKEMYVSIKNFAEYQTIPQNCAVYSVTVGELPYEDEPVPNISATLPCGISIGSSKSEADAITGEGYSTNSGTYYYSYSFYEYKNRSVSFDYSVSKNDEKVHKIQLRCDSWDY